jgi:hypothetical protein
MTLTVGIKTYDGRTGHKTRDLVQNPEFRRLFDQHFRNCSDDVKRRAMTKLARWVSDSANPWIPHWKKGQGKSFSGYKAVVEWLRYKTEKQFQANAVREKELAEQINACPGIRETVAVYATQYLQTHWDKVLTDQQRRSNRDQRGRYSFFYSNILWRDRRLGDGIDYFRGKKNPSLSEMAAFLADYALKCSERPKTTSFTRGHDQLRYNAVRLNHEVAEAMQALETAFQETREQIPQLAAASEESANTLRLLQDGAPMEQFMADENLLANFNYFKRRFAAGMTDEALYASSEFRNYRRALRQAFRSQQTLIDTALQQKTASVTNEGMEQRRAEERMNVSRKNRLEFNVDPEHAWTEFMMRGSQVIGAGPSSTTASTLELVKLITPSDIKKDEVHMQKAYYSVAVSLFAFWRRKKSTLQGKSAVHTWNEVITALENYLWEASEYIFPLDLDAVAPQQDMQCRTYVYPDRFTERGTPIYLNHGQV